MAFFSIVVATHKRPDYLTELLDSVKGQTIQDYELIISHTGLDDGTKEVVEKFSKDGMPIYYYISPRKGASQQRNYGVTKTQGEWLVMPDDDVIWEKDYLENIYTTTVNSPELKGISATVTNQHFEPLGLYTKFILALTGIFNTKNISGKLIGPAINFLPQLQGSDFEKVDWMPIGVCAYHLKTYRKNGMIPEHFIGYSFAEDVYVSSNLAQSYHITLCRKARLFHYDLGNKALTDIENLIKMQVTNRRYICKYVLKKNSIITNYQLIIWYLMMNLNIYLLKNKSFKLFSNSLKGLIKGLHAKI